MIILNYDTETYNFKKIICEYLNETDLENLSIEKNDIMLEGKDQSTLYHKKFYKNLDSDIDKKFKKLYDNFIISKIFPIFNEKIIYQTYPTFRLQYKRNIAVFQFHKDKDYNHSDKMVNFFLPITKCYDTNAVWIETEEDKGDYNPIICDYGNLVMFNGANLKHGNKINLTGQTRVSLDFRIIKEKDYLYKEQKSSKSKNKKLIVGDYYQKM
jgi:hypothetical protein